QEPRGGGARERWVAGQRREVHAVPDRHGALYRSQRDHGRSGTATVPGALDHRCRGSSARSAGRSRRHPPPVSTLARARSSPTTAKASERSSAPKFARLGLATDWDFLLHLPLRYVDETRVTPIAELTGGEEAQVEGTIAASEISYRGRRQLTARL